MKKKPTRAKSPAPRAPRTSPSARAVRTPRSPAAPTPAIIRPRTEEATIVGVGASAGGLEAFSQLLRGLTADSGLAIVFVQHLAPRHDSALVQLLSTHSPLPVVQAAEGMRVEANHVYVIPPNVQLVIDRSDDLHLRPRPKDRTQYTPIDSFFSSLARAAGPRAIGVILSGTASDGALGIRDIKAAGGVTVVQTPNSAKYDGMPRAAIATGMVDLILRPEALGAKVAQLARHGYLSAVARTEDELSVDERQLGEIFELLRPVSGVDFQHYKLPTIKRRLFRRMALKRLNDIGDYLRLLKSDPGEVRNLYQDLLIHVTRFFREPESFEAMAREVFPQIVEGRTAEQPIRIWVSGCATGEEAYSVAIALTEFLQRGNADKRIQIFATDLSETAIEHARAGVYPATIENDVNPDRLRRYFSKIDGGYRVSKMIRDLCVFARQDLSKDPPFSRLDLVLCRNVLIYMDAPLQKKLLSVFHFALSPSGFLVLGQAETAGSQGNLFALVDKKYRIHRKRLTQAATTIAFPVDYRAAVEPKRPTVDAGGGSSEKVLLNEVSRILTDRFAPPGVVVDAELQIIQFRGQTGAFLEPAPGEASLSLLKMAREGLLYGLRTAITAARKSRAPVQKTGLQVRAGSGWRPVTIEVIPLTSGGRLHYLVLFDAPPHKNGAPPPSDPPPSRGTGGRDAKRFDFLQRELAASREYLQSIIQELEAANEELQSANEEILSSNEELQSTNEELDTAKEELQSTNEELNTVNEEMHGRNEELTRVNSDLLNLLGSVQIAIVIVGSDLRIRRFTPMAERVLNLIAADVDRSIAHINPNLDGVNLEGLIGECIDAVAPIEREVRDREGRWYSLRIRPYKSVDNKIDGAVLSLFDIDAPKRSEEIARNAIAFAERVLLASNRAMAIVDRELAIRSANDAFARIFGAEGANQLRQKSLTALIKPGRAVADLRQLFDGRHRGGSAKPIELQSADGIAAKLRIHAQTFPAFDPKGDQMILVSSVGEDEPAES